MSMKLYMKTQGSVIFGVVTSSKNTRDALITTRLSLAMYMIGNFMR